MIEIYTDGSCKMSTRDGGWAFIVVKDDEVIHESYGTDTETTNNIMELTALQQGLQFAASYPVPVTLYTDSKYCCDGYNDWCFGWERKNWKTSTNKKVENLALWQSIHKLRYAHVSVKWVRGHNGHKWNEHVDSLTRMYE